MLALQDATSDIFREAIVISLPSVNREDSYSLFYYIMNYLFHGTTPFISLTIWPGI